MDNIKFDIERDDGGSITGFTLKNLGDTETDEFCISFITAQGKGKADILFEGNEIVFKHRGVTLDEADQKYGVFGSSAGGEFRTKISDADKISLSQLLELEGAYAGCKLSVKLNLTWGKGFTLQAKKNE